jgi:hypothetical protein
LYPYTNPPPTVVLSPTNNASYTASASVTLAPAPTRLTIPLLGEFLHQWRLLGSVTNAPYTLTATGWRG